MRKYSTTQQCTNFCCIELSSFVRTLCFSMSSMQSFVHEAPGRLIMVMMAQSSLSEFKAEGKFKC